jgi:hypothetical protein
MHSQTVTNPQRAIQEPLWSSQSYLTSANIDNIGGGLYRTASVNPAVVQPSNTKSASLPENSHSQNRPSKTEAIAQLPAFSADCWSRFRSISCVASRSDSGRASIWADSEVPHRALRSPRACQSKSAQAERDLASLPIRLGAASVRLEPGWSIRHVPT